MSVRLADDGTIVLEADCLAEEAELLLQLLQAAPEALIDWRRCGHLHTAVLQVILAARPTYFGRCGDVWVEQWVTARQS
jgi:hypothetical protein